MLGRVTNIIFIRTDGLVNPDRDKLCRSIITAVSTVIELPSEVQIQFGPLATSVHGMTMIDYRIHNRVSLNSSLTLTEVTAVLIHELIHLHQYHIGQLRTTRTGKYYWNGRQVHVDADLSYEAYKDLPWERDVTERLPKIMTKAVEYALSHK